MRLPSATTIPLQPAETSRDRLQTAARELESQFAQMMIKSMRSTSFGDPLMGDDSTYRDMYDQQLSRELTKGRGLGLAPMIERQLSRSLPGQPPGIAPAGQTAPVLLGNGMTQSLPLAMPLSSGRGAGAGISLAPTSSGTSLPAMAPLPPPLPRQPVQAAAIGGPADPAAKVDSSSPEAFVRSIWPHAQETARELGVSAKALVAQAALETGWGRRLVGGDGSHNLFGIKATGGWRGNRVDSATHEFVNGRRENQRAEFRAYGSVRDSFADYARLMRKDRYAGALAAGTDPSRFASALQRAGYATDPAYAAKISAIANGPTLQRALSTLDNGTDRMVAAAPATHDRG